LNARPPRDARPGHPVELGLFVSTASRWAGVRLIFDVISPRRVHPLLTFAAG